MRKNSKVFLAYFIILLGISMFVIYSEQNKTNINNENYSYTTLLKELKNDNDFDILKITISKSSDIIDSGTAKVYRYPNDLRTHDLVYIPSINAFMDFLQNEPRVVDNDYLIIEPQKPANTKIILDILMFVVFISFSLFILSAILQKNSGGNKAFNFGKSKAKMIIDEKGEYNFSKVAGLKEEKFELKEVVEFLKAPKKFTDIGARIPKGILLVGPPGTGKTLLAKSVAGESNVPFFTISGSEFVEMFVGVGASRVRDLFEQAKNNSPCIIFIDEIDAVGRRRGSGLGGGHDEREQTLNQILVEMDGFAKNSGIIIFAATNRVDILDPALLRPGRFDRKILVGKPDASDRLEILNVHSKNKKLNDDVDLEVIAKTTAGFTGADIENLLNEAAIISATDNLENIPMENIRRAFIKIGIGAEKKGRAIKEKDRKITAYHEAGHAIVQELSSELDCVHVISIIKTGGAAGYMMPLPVGEYTHTTKTRLNQEISVSLSGRVAEQIIFDDITAGASSDIRHATSIARDMVTKFGMSKKLGTIEFSENNNDNFLGHDLSGSRNYSETIAEDIDIEIKNIIEENTKLAKNILQDNIEILHQTAKLLLEKEKITGNEFRSLFPEGVLIKKDIIKLED